MRSMVLLVLFTTPNPLDASERWVEQFREGPFTFRSEFRIRQGRLTRDLAQLKRELESSLGLRIGNAPIRVSFFADRRRYVDYMKRHVPEGVHRKALFVKGPEASHVYAYRSSSFDTDVRHECTHALVHNALQFIPLWMDEGLAEYFESPAGARVRPSRLKEMRNTIRWSRLVGFKGSLERLENIDDIGQMGSSEYRYSWAWIHYLLNDSKESREVLVRYLREIQNGNPPGAFSEFASDALPDTDSKLVRHFRYFR